MAQMYKCYHCNTNVPDGVHQEHRDLYDAFTLAEVRGIDDCFVHLVGSTPEQRDAEDYVVFCDRCFVQELAENLQ